MISSEQSDATFLAVWRAGGTDALAALFDRYERPVFCYLLGLLHDPHAAEDVLQDTFVRAVQKCDGVTGESFRGWLFAVAHQQALLHRRKGRRAAHAASEPLLDLLGATPDPAVAAEAADTAAALNRLLAELPTAQRDVIRLRLFDGLKFRQVAERLGCPLNTALARMHDGLRTLRTLWEERHA